MLKQLRQDLQSLANPKKAAFFPKFFKAGPGEYAEGDQFLGVIVPDQRKVAKKYKNLPLDQIKELLYSPIHEHRLTALFILVAQYQKAKTDEEKKIFYDFYLKHRAQVNNWDLVDSSAHKIVGDYLLTRDRSILYELAKSKSLWDRRIAMIAMWTFIREGELEEVLKVAELLVNDSHDLIHKAVGWMLRELGKKDQVIEEKFLKKHHKTMPPTMLRYAIEKFDQQKKDFYMGR